MHFNKKHHLFSSISPNAMRLWCVACAVTFCLANPSFARDNIEGIWINETGRGAVQILPCLDTGNYIHTTTGSAILCGHIVWIDPDRDERGQPLKDTLNEDPEKRKRVICGLQIISDLKYQMDGTWEKGRIYDPRRGRTFDVAARLLSEDQLEVTGYLGAKFLGKSFVWKRASQDIGTCQKE